MSISILGVQTLLLAVAHNVVAVFGLELLRNRHSHSECDAPPFNWGIHFRAESAHEAAEKAGAPSDEEIEAAVMWRMGPAYDKPIMPVTHLMVGSSRNGVVYEAHDGATSLRAEYICGDKGGPRVKAFLIKSHRVVHKVLAGLASAPPAEQASADMANTSHRSLRIFADWEDARSHHLAPKVRPGASSDTCAPVQLTFNRQRCLPEGARSDVAASVLWPPFFQRTTLGAAELLPVAWSQRPRALVWRGQGSGTCDDPSHCERCLPLQPDRDPSGNPFLGQFKLDVALKALLRNWAGNPQWVGANRADIEACLMGFQRWRAFTAVGNQLNRTHGVEVDVKLGPKAIPFLPSEFDESAVSTMMRELFGLETGGFVDLEGGSPNKYRLALDGNDYASSLPHDLTSGAVVLAPAMRWEWKFNYLLTPWSHYIPLQSDLSDLDEKISWCEGHPVACQAIAKRGTALTMRWHADSSIEEEIQHRVLKRYVAGYGKASCGTVGASNADFENCVAQT